MRAVVTLLNETVDEEAIEIEEVEELIDERK